MCSSAPSERYLAAISRPSPEPPPVIRMRLSCSNRSWNMGLPAMPGWSVERDVLGLDQRRPARAFAADVSREFARLARRRHDQPERLELVAKALVGGGACDR